MRPLEAMLVEIMFGRVDHIPDRDCTALCRRAAPMTEQRRDEHLVLARQQRRHIPPHVARQQEGMQQHQGWLVTGHGQV